MSRKRSEILIVSDEPDTRIFLSNLLTAENYHPVTAESRADGQKLALDKKPAVIIIDMMMPKQGSIRMYRFLKEHLTLKKIPVIMLSTIDQEHFFKYRHIQGNPEGTGAPAPEAYLEKPLETEELMGLVRKLSGEPETDRAKPESSPAA